MLWAQSLHFPQTKMPWYWLQLTIPGVQLLHPDRGSITREETDWGHTSVGGWVTQTQFTFLSYDAAYDDHNKTMWNVDIQSVTDGVCATVNNQDNLVISFSQCVNTTLVYNTWITAVITWTTSQLLRVFVLLSLMKHNKNAWWQYVARENLTGKLNAAVSK